MSLDIDIQSKLVALRQRFLQSLEETILELDSLSNALPEHLEPAEVMAAIRYRAHRLAGTAPSLGYVTVGDLAGQVENAVNQWTSCQSLGAEHQVLVLVDSLLDEIELTLYRYEPPQTTPT